MTSSKPKTGVLLDSAVDLLFEIHLLRGDCCVAAESFLSRDPSGQEAIEECARLEESLARVYRTLQSTLKGIQRARAGRPRPAE